MKINITEKATEELKKIILARSVDKNLIIEGQVGTGKTRIAKAISSFYDTDFARIDCSEETLPHKLVGYFDPPLVISKGYQEDSYIYGPLASSMLKGGCLFINEINRMPESTQNSLLTALDEGILEIPKLIILGLNLSTAFILPRIPPVVKKEVIL